MMLGGLAAGVRFLPCGWRACGPALLLAAATTAWALAGRHPFAWGAALAMTLVARSGLWRLARGAELGPGGVQLGVPELRLAAVWGLSILVLAVIALLMLVVVLCAAYAAASAGPGFEAANIATWTPAIIGAQRVFLGGVSAGCAVAFVYIAVRLSLAEAATAELGRVQVLSAFALTRGRSISLAVAHLILALPASAVVAWVWLSGSSLAAIIAGALAVDALWLPSGVGLMAYAYRTVAART